MCRLASEIRLRSPRSFTIEHVFESLPSPIAGLSLLETLNEEQAAAVTHQGGPLLVLAGAGTGKTTTLSARVGWLVEQGVAPERVLLLTFTRRAAREMLGRVRSIVGARALRARHGASCRRLDRARLQHI